MEDNFRLKVVEAWNRITSKVYGDDVWSIASVDHAQNLNAGLIQSAA
jgi:hypothetical protein